LPIVVGEALGARLKRMSFPSSDKEDLLEPGL
jgi:hypothetical protein